MPKGINMKTVREILDKKGNQIFSVEPTTKVFDALKLMAEKNVGALLVVDNDKLVGIMSERDYARKVVLRGKSSKDESVSEIMSSNVVCIDPSKNTEECMALMITKKIRHLPILENEKLIGIISIGDVVKAVIDEKEFMIDQLVTYIKGGH